MHSITDCKVTINFVWDTSVLSAIECTSMLRNVVTFLNHLCMTVRYTTKRCSIKLKGEEAEIGVTGSQLEEEANMVEVEGEQ